MKNHGTVKFVQSTLLGLTLALTGSHGLAQASLFLRDYPASYTVQDDDTLWTIASQFLQDPMRWPDVWMPDAYLENPEAIFPGDVIWVENINGLPRLVAVRNIPVERRSPEIRELPLTSSIPAIPLESISGSFTTNRIVRESVYATAPYVVSTLGNNLVIGTGDEIYARGNWPEGARSFEIYRQINHYEDPQTEASLGVELRTLGFATVVADGEDGVKRLLVNSAASEIAVGDHLLVREESRLDPTIFPTEPVSDLNGRIIALTSGERMASQLDSLVINLGLADGLRVEDIVSIEKPGEAMVDSQGRSRKTFSDQVREVFSRERLELPNQAVGTALVYRTFDKLSYAVILTITQPTGVGDFITSPP